MNKPRKYNGVYKLPIKKHTPVRRPMSKWLSYPVWFDGVNSTRMFYVDTTDEPRRIVQDISKGLKNPLDPTQSVYNIQYMNRLADRQLEVKSLPERMAEDMTQRQDKFLGLEFKPSLLTRVKERFKK